MREMNRLMCVAILVLALMVGTVLTGTKFVKTAESQENEKTAEQVYKNIQVFKGLPASQLLGAMNFMAGSLGVSCNHCHAPNQFAKDDKLTKQTARQHVKMMRSINDANFEGKTVVNCVTCHGRQARPASALNLTQGSFPAAEKTSTNSESLPTVDQILDKYLLAIGGRKRIGKLETLTMSGTRETRNGNDAPSTEQLEVLRKAPNKLLMNLSTPANSSSQAFNGASGWRNFNGRVSVIGGPDLLGAKRDADFYKDFNFKEHYLKMAVVGKEHIDGREALVIEATFPNNHPARAMFGIASEKLYFDTQSGLLIRRYMEYQTVLGALPEATDYLGYRKTKGMMFPFMIRLSRPPLVVTQKLVTIEVNKTIDDARFDMPAAR